MRRWFAIISGLVLGIGLGIVAFQTTQCGANRDKMGLGFLHKQMVLIASELKQYEKLNKRYPNNDDSYFLLADAIEQRMKQGNGYLARSRVISHRILAWWGDPIIYENRRGLSPKKFDWSGVNNDPYNIYSFRVDNGIYLWSIGARDASQREDAKMRSQGIIMIAALVISAVLLIAYVSNNLQNVKNRAFTTRILFTIWFSLSGIFITLIISLPLSIFMCGGGCPGLQITRTGKLTREYAAVMRSYRNHGIINNNTLTKVMYNLNQDRKDKNYHKY